MKILYWVTSLNGEIAAHIRYTIKHTDHEILLAFDHWESFQKEACQALWPIEANVVKRNSIFKIQKFNADVVVIDNNVPPFPVAKCLFNIWHGLGWKGPQDRAEFATFYRRTAKVIGEIDKPNPRFIWKAYGFLDLEQRIDRMEMPPENVHNLGMAAGDDMFHLTIDREKLSSFYKFDTTKKTILLAPTWHYDSVFGHWGGDEEQTFRMVFELAKELDSNIIVRMHDRKRYDPKYVEFMERIAGSAGNVFLKYKNDYMDNTVDMLLADLMITNFSSIANPYYVRGMPTVHIYPVPKETEDVEWRQITSKGIKNDERISKDLIWKLALEENGGSLAHSVDELLAQIRAGLENPEINRQDASAFNEKYIYKSDGKTCERITAAMEKQVAGLPKSNLPPLIHMGTKWSLIKSAVSSLFS
jgi:CDP-Glycerol:Poly(glycerophosphate) glycerophosphotransferase